METASDRLRRQGIGCYRKATEHYTRFIKAKMAGDFDLAKVEHGNYKLFHSYFVKYLDRAILLNSRNA